MRITLIGAGNIGYHLGLGLAGQGHELLQVFSRSLEKARELAQTTGAEAVNSLEAISPGAELYFLAVPDDAIKAAAAALAPRIGPQSLVLHCSGATPSSVLQPFFRRYGVWWSPQSFSRQQPHDWPGTPICLYASELADLDRLEKLAAGLSQAIYRVDDAQREVLHLAAVFVNNFTNHCLTVGHQLCRDSGLDFSILHPIMRQTVEKAVTHPPAEVQTGPARRGDQQTILRHLQWLHEHHPEWMELYKLLSHSISTTTDN